MWKKILLVKSGFDRHAGLSLDQLTLNFPRMNEADEIVLMSESFKRNVRSIEMTWPAILVSAARISPIHLPPL